MRIEDQKGDALPEATVTVDDDELIDLLQGLADLVEGKREHLHLQQLGVGQLVIRRAHEDDAGPLDRQMDWWLGPAVLFGVLFLVIGVVATIRWAAGLI